jgi:hypothetical protein
MHGQGVHHFWGFSPALDVQEVYTAAMTQFDALYKLESAESEEPLRVLLVMPGDPRSVLKTLCQRLRHVRRPVHVRTRYILWALALVDDAVSVILASQQVYVFDRPAEVLARHILLLQVAFDWELPIRQRASVYLELFGNCLIQVRAVT